MLGLYTSEELKKVVALLKPPAAKTVPSGSSNIWKYSRAVVIRFVAAVQDLVVGLYSSKVFKKEAPLEPPAASTVPSRSSIIWKFALPVVIGPVAAQVFVTGLYTSDEVK